VPRRGGNLHRSFAVKNLLSYLVIPIAFVLGFFGVAAAQSTAGGSEGSLVDLARPVLEAVVSGKPGLATALALILAAALARRYLAPRVAFFASDAGASVLVLLSAFGAAMAAAITGGASWSPELAWKALAIAVPAAGGFSLIKPIVKAVEARYPWAAKVTRLVSWVFDKPAVAPRATVRDHRTP
jgi:hypothetical protein